MEAALAFDLGTSAVKATLYSEEGVCLGEKTIAYPLYCSTDNVRREQEPDQWWESVCEASRALLSDKDVHVAGIGLSGHSLGIVPVDKRGRLLSQRTPIWSDSRASCQAEDFFEKVGPEEWYGATGCGFVPAQYPLFKLGWYREHEGEIYRRACCFLGTKDYVNLKMTQAACTDRSYASGSGVYDQRRHAYIPRFAEAAGIDGAKLPEIVKSTDIIGELTRDAAAAMGLHAGIPVIAGGVDNACMCLGAGCYAPGRAYASLGTSAWVAMAADDPCLNYEKRVYIFEHCVDGLWVPAAGIFSAGSSLNWVVERMFSGLPADPWMRLNELAAASPVGANGVIFCPALAGGTYVDPSPSLMGAFFNLSLGISSGDLARAAFEGICCELALAYDALGGCVPLDGPLLLAGGGARNDFWCQMYADVFGTEVYRTQVMQNAASLGAAALVWRGLGRWKDFRPLDAAHARKTRFSPDATRAAAYRIIREKFWKACQMQAQLAL